MTVYRLSREKYVNDLSGMGAWLNGGRWNSRSKFALYTAQNVSLAKLEVAVHLDLDLIPNDYMLVEIYLPDDSSIKTFGFDDLVSDWNSIPHSESTQLIGDDFLEANEFLALKVPSAIVSQEFNCIINPQHSEFSLVKVINVEAFSFDERLFFR